MEGITILATNVINNGNIGLGVFSVLAGLVFLVIAIWATLDTESCSFLWLLLLVFPLLLIGISEIKDKSTTTQYKVIISSDVTLTDFNNKYDIISQDGEIYVIKDKEIVE
jgi:hypothetical protein